MIDAGRPLCRDLHPASVIGSVHFLADIAMST
jgi:hypothetical protein